VYFFMSAFASRAIARASGARNGRSGNPISPRRRFASRASTARSTCSIAQRKSAAEIPSPPDRLLSPTSEKSNRKRIPPRMSPPVYFPPRMRNLRSMSFNRSTIPPYSSSLYGSIAGPKNPCLRSSSDLAEVFART